MMPTKLERSALSSNGMVGSWGKGLYPRGLPFERFQSAVGGGSPKPFDGAIAKMR